MRTSRKNLNPSLKRQILTTFIQAIADLKSPEEAKLFVSDFFTDKEVEVLSKRLAVGYWLKKGRSYVNIKENLKVSSATIASIQSTMSLKGFQMAIKKIEAEEWANKWSEKIQGFIKK